MLGLLWVNGLTIDNLNLRNSPMWTTHPTFCNNVVVSNNNIYAPSTSHNTDGIDPDSCTDVYIYYNTISTGGARVTLRLTTK